MRTLRMLLTCAGLGVALSLLFPMPNAMAQGIGLGPRVGYQKAADADEGKLMAGAALRLRLLPFLGAEGSIDYRSEQFGDGTVTTRSWPVQVTGLFYPLPVLYGAVGAGWYNTTFDVSDDLDGVIEDRTEQEFGWHFGAGAELPLGTAASLTGDVRYVFLDYDFEEIPGVGDSDSDFYMITVGVLFGL